jgi:hypothetical protein
VIRRLLGARPRWRSRRGSPHGLPVVEYSPRRDGQPDPGEVVWAWVPYEDDPSQGKDRPVVIVGRVDSRLAGVALTSRRGDGDRMPVGTGSWDAERRDSFAKLDRVLSLDPSAVRREGSTFDRTRFDQLVAALRQRRLVGPVVVTPPPRSPID